MDEDSDSESDLLTISTLRLPESLEEEQEDERMEEKLVNEEYKTWKKNAPFLYDMLLSTALEWPTLTTQWLPDVQEYDNPRSQRCTNQLSDDCSVPDKNYRTHRLLLGTHTTHEAPNYLQIAHVQLPKPVTLDTSDYDEDREEIGGYGGGGASKRNPPAEVRFEIVQKIDHKGEVNKARYQPQNPNIIATMCTDGRVLIFDRTKHPLQPTGNVNPQMELIGHEAEGFGLSWNPHEAGHLATGSEDQTVRLWDITKFSQTNKALHATRTYTHHAAIVNDVQYHPLYPTLIGTVSDDLTLQILDLRSSDTTKSALQAVDGHQDAINALAFNPGSEFIFVTGSADKSIGVWDLRNLKSKIHALTGHNDSVTALSWSPFEEAILASSSYDRRVIFWDLSKIGEEQTPEDAEDGPPELYVQSFSLVLNYPPCFV